MLRNYLIFIFAVLCLLTASTSWASCSYKSGYSYQTQTVNFNTTIVVPWNTSGGSSLGSQTTGAWNNGSALFGCTTAWTYRWELIEFPMMSTVSNIFATNLDGIGYQVTLNDGSIINSTGVVGQRDFAEAANANVSLPGTGVKVEFFKTKGSKIQSGSVTQGVLAKMSAVNWAYTGQVNLGNNSFVQLSCTLKTTSLVFELNSCA